ncbi:hypothetical protein [Vreelandella piezotolerans]|uniref:hypothetical protein n=1 Tax=Vreelandella piezotolerans TaxID=2609667 RepID=UPI001C6274DB|nr:hypothetical protein [Halomonas piezotolerans]
MNLTKKIKTYSLTLQNHSKNIIKDEKKMNFWIKLITLIIITILLAGCSKEEREANSLHESLMKDIEAIDALENNTSIIEKLTIYSQAKHKIERLRTRYAATKKGEELLENSILSSDLTAEDIISEALALEDRASDELSEIQIQRIIIDAIPTPEIRNHRLESHGISLARQGNIEEANEVIPSLQNSLSITIVQLEVAKAYHRNSNIEAAKNISLEASDTISQYSLDEQFCSTINCENEEARKRFVEAELRLFRSELYSS